jgi:predicted glycoside hydrolase/deacetylase ChbG (UPF0249 family)
MTAGHEARAVKLAKATGLPVGIHLSLTLGRARAPIGEIPDLTDSKGYFIHSPIHFLTRPERVPGLVPQIAREFTAQLAAAADLGLRATHIDSHQHVHMHPVLFAIAEAAATHFGIRHVRRVQEPFYRFELYSNIWPALQRRNHLKWLLLRRLNRKLAPHLSTPRRFFGVKYSGIFTASVLKAVLSQGTAGGVLEIGVHPGFPIAPQSLVCRGRRYDQFIESSWRRKELMALCDPALPSLIERLGFVLTSFDGVPKGKH